MQLCQDTHAESLTEMHGLLLEQVSRWNTLRVEAMVEEPSALWQWVQSELPNVVGLLLALEVIHQVLEGDTDSQEPFISAPRLNFCFSKESCKYPKYNTLTIHSPDAFSNRYSSC